MPHQDYLRRLIDEAENPPSTPSAGMRPLNNQHAETEAGQQSRSPRISPRLSTVAARALAALEDIDSGRSSDGGGCSSQLLQTPPPDKSRVPSNTHSTTRMASPSRRCGKAWEAMVKRKMQHAKGLSLGLGSPSGSIGSRSLSAAASRHSGRSPANSIASAQNAGSLVANIAGSPRSILRTATNNNNSVVDRGMRVAASNLDHPPSKSEMYSPPRMNRSPHVWNDQHILQGHPQGATPSSSQEIVIDLTGENSFEDVGQLMPQVENGQAVRGHGLFQKPGDDQQNNNSAPAMQQKENNPTVTGIDLVHTPKQEHNELNLMNATESALDRENNDDAASNVRQPGMSGDNGDEEPMLPNAMTNGDQTVQPSNGQHSGENERNTKSQPTTVESKKSSVSTKRKLAGAAKKAVAARRAPAKKSSCLLVGKLFFTKKDGNPCRIIRGYWEYEDQAKSTPQRFELCCDVPSDVESIPLTAGGVFHGLFVYQWSPKGKPENVLIIQEGEVNLSFAECCTEQLNDDSLPITVKGTGQNELGKFDLLGTATQTPAGDSYNLQLTKTYTELFSSNVSHPGSDGNEKEAMLCGQKRKFSMSDASSGSEGDLDEKQPRRESTRAISVSPEESHASNGSDTVDIFNEASRDNEAVETPASVSTKPGGKSVFDISQAATKKRKTKYGSVSLLLSMSECVPINSPKSHQSWQEFGDLQHIDHSITAQTLSWNVKNVKPKYSQMSCDFFDSTGIVNVQDLLQANVDYLCLRLMAYSEFKAACAFAIWKMKSIHKQVDTTFHSLCCPEYAKQNILAWKHAADIWYKEVAGANFLDSTQRNVTVPGDDQLPLENILGSYGASILKNNCNISTAQQLLSANGEDTIRRLTGVVGRDFQGRREKDVQLIVEGMLYAWSLDAKHKLQANESATKLTSDGRPSFRTPLSYVDLEFIRSQNISSDEQLLVADPSLLAHRYTSFLGGTHDKKISAAEAFEISNKWQQGARLVLGFCSKQDICDTLPQNTRLDKDSSPQVTMHTVLNLCKTVPDGENGGLPKRTIFTFDRSSNLLYEFTVSIKKSLCSPGAGMGAFLTYKSAKVLRGSSRWKKKGYIPEKVTRRPLDASFSFSGATVTLKGEGLHGDEHHYGPENDCSVGLYSEFSLDDFIDSKDNITFSSKHMGCALVELESRYAPLLKQDRKTDKVFIVKDFLYSNEPSSWRFDVDESLIGHPQVVDFTDDTTGAPHDVARSHVSMYVNEVGHNMDLVENVEALSPTSRSVTYYIHIDTPMTRGETVELLVNYKEHYESMRERRGYGKANLSDGVKSDAHDITRVLRNLKERFLVEESILNFTEKELSQVIDFFIERVWDGVKTATTTLETSFQGDASNFLRQCIALRRMDWLSRILQTRFHEIIGGTDIESLPYVDTSDRDCIFHRDMWVFVHEWPKNDPRPPYTGLATIDKISKDKHNRNVFELSLTDGKCIEDVPEAVVTVPTDDEFKGVPKRIYSNWMKWKKQQNLPQMRLRMMKNLESVRWDPSFIQDISAVSASASFEMQAKTFQSLRWEFAEELLFLLVKNERLSHPFDENTWCPISISLSKKCLHLIADSLLMGRDKQHICKTLMVWARDAANELKEVINKNDLSVISKLALQEKPKTRESIHVLVVEAIHINRLSTEQYSKDPMPLDLEWYLIHQIVLAIHPLSSLIDWGDNPPYSIENLCDNIGLDKDASYLNFYVPKAQEWRPLVSKTSYNI